jgi:hypothetical protein
MNDEVNDFLAHYGVVGMKWGKRRSSPNSSGSGRSGGSSGGSGSGSSGGRQNGTTEQKPGMSRKKKIAIGVGIGLTVAVGAAVAISVLNNKRATDMAVSQLAANVSTLRGKSRFDMIANAAKMNKAENSPAVRQMAEKTARAVSEKAGQKVQQAIESSPAKRGLLDRAKEVAINKAKDMAYERAKEQAINKAKDYAIERAKTMLRPASSIPQKRVVFNPKTGLYEEVDETPENVNAQRTV